MTQTQNPFKKKPKESLTALSLQLPETMLQELDELAERAEMTRSAIAREVLRYGIETAHRLISEADEGEPASKYVALRDVMVFTQKVAKGETLICTGSRLLIQDQAGIVRETGLFPGGTTMRSVESSAHSPDPVLRWFEAQQAPNVAFLTSSREGHKSRLKIQVVNGDDFQGSGPYTPKILKQITEWQQLPDYHRLMGSIEAELSEALSGPTPYQILDVPFDTLESMWQTSPNVRNIFPDAI